MQPLFLHVTLSIIAVGCRNRCKHCSVAAAISDSILIPYEQVEEVISILRAEQEKSPPLYGHVNPCLMYEPMDYPDVARVQKLFHTLSPDAPLVRTMATNGQRIAEDPAYEQLIRDLRENGLEQFQLTLHGLEQNHDWFAGRRGAYRDIMEAAKRIVSAGMRIDWNLFLSKRNIAEFPNMVRAAREVSRGAEVSEMVNIWGPAGRAGRQSHLLITQKDLDRLPDEIRAINLLPQYLPESAWVEYARSGEMQTMLRSFRERARNAGGIPDCSFRIDCDNIADFTAMIGERRLAGKSEVSAPEDSEIMALAEKCGDPESKVLYRVSTMYQEWRRRERTLSPDPTRSGKASGRYNEQYPLSHAGQSEEPTNLLKQEDSCDNVRKTA